MHYFIITIYIFSSMAPQNNNSSFINLHYELNTYPSKYFYKTSTVKVTQVITEKMFVSRHQ